MEENDTVYGCILNLFKAKNAVVSGSVLFPTPVIVLFSVCVCVCVGGGGGGGGGEH